MTNLRLGVKCDSAVCADGIHSRPISRRAPSIASSCRVRRHLTHANAENGGTQKQKKTLDTHSTKEVLKKLSHHL